MAYHSCKNCEYPFGNSYKFCPNCGLKQADDITLKSLFYNTIQNYLAFDARFFKSFIPLLTKPGFLPKQFVKGKRLTFLHPAQLYLFSTILFFFVFSFHVNSNAEVLNSSLSDVFSKKNNKIDDGESNKLTIEDSIRRVEVRQTLENNKALLNLTEKQIDSIVTANVEKEKVNMDWGFSTKKIDSLIDVGSSNEVIYREMGLKKDAGMFQRQAYKQTLKFYKSPQAGSVYKYFIQSIPIALFFLLPIFALLLRLFYYKLKSYAKHLVFSFYFFAFIFFVFTIIAIVNYIYDIPDEIDVLLILSCFFYLLIAIKNYYNKGWLNTIVKSVLLVFTYFTFIIPVGIICTILVSFLFY